MRKTLAALPLLLLLGTLALWVRSYWVEDHSWLVTFAPHSKARYRHEYGLTVLRGEVEFVHQRCVLYSKTEEPSFSWDFEPAGLGGNSSFESDRERATMGFAYLSADLIHGGSHGGDEEKDREHDVLFPLWFVAFCFAVPALFWLRSAWKRTHGVRRTRVGLCAKCGYDLRASALRCPECGLAVPTTVKLVQGSWRRELRPVAMALLLLAIIATSALVASRAWFNTQHADWAEDVRIRDATDKAMGAAGSNDEEEFDRQIKAGAAFDPEQAADAMWRAIDNLQPGMARRLVEAGADVNINDGQALTNALWNGYFPLALRMVQKGAHPNVLDPGGRTPLYLCAEFLQRQDQLELVKALLERGADPRIADTEGATPLHQLARWFPEEDPWDRIDFARLLIERGADVNARTKQGETPLKLAKAVGRTTFAAFLISQGAKE